MERWRRRRRSHAEGKLASGKAQTVGVPEKADEFLSDLAGAPKCWTQRREAPVEPNAASGSGSGSTGKDHLLLILRAVINDMHVPALVVWVPLDHL